MSRSTLLKRSIIRVYSIVTFTASVITSRRQRHGKCRPENLPFYKLSRALTTNINPLYSSGMIPGACTIRRTNKSDSGVAVSLSLSVSFREPSKEYFSHILAHTLTIHCPSLSLSLSFILLFPRIPFSSGAKLQRNEGEESFEMLYGAYRLHQQVNASEIHFLFVGEYSRIYFSRGFPFFFGLIGVGVVEIEYFYDGNYFVKEFRGTREEMFSRKYREKVGYDSRKKTEGMSKIWASGRLNPKIPWLTIFRLKRFKLLANSKFHQTESGQNPAGQGPLSGIASFPRRLAREDLTRHLKHASKGEDACGT